MKTLKALKAFNIGRVHYEEGKVFDTTPPAAEFLVTQGTCEYHDPNKVEPKPKTPAKKKAVAKKARYTRRDVRPEE